MDRNFDDDIKFNKYKLDEVCENHANIRRHWSKKSAESKSDLGEAKTSLKLKTAQKYLEVRTNWDESKYGKQTEAAISAVVETDKDIIEANNLVNKHQRDLNIYEAGVDDFDHRKEMINNEVKLLIGGFYATPNGGKKEDANDQAAREIRRKKNVK